MDTHSWSNPCSRDGDTRGSAWQSSDNWNHDYSKDKSERLKIQEADFHNDGWWVGNMGGWCAEQNGGLWSVNQMREWWAVENDAVAWRRDLHAGVAPSSYLAPCNLREIVCEVSATMPFIPTDQENIHKRAARFITNLCEAMLDLQQNKINGWGAAYVKHYQRCASTDWDKGNGNVKAILPSTSALSMMGNMQLGVTQNDWPPVLDAKSQHKFQFVWNHFPCAKGPGYSSDKPRQLYAPRERTLNRFQKDMEVQVGFTMDVMITARDRVARMRPSKQGYVAMVFNQVGAGAFVDRLSPEEQILCMERIMKAMMSALRKRVFRACFLFVSGGQMDCNGNWLWTNKMGNSVSVEVVPEVTGFLFAGSFDCLALAQKLASLEQFCHVGVTMAADKHRIGNGWLSHHWNRSSNLIELSVLSAADENNTRRSSLLPWVLKVNAPWLQWSKVDIFALKQTKEAAESFLSQPGRSDYNRMMRGFTRISKNLKANFMRIQVPELQGIETVVVEEATDHDMESAEAGASASKF